MNKIVRKILLVVDKFLPQIYLRQPGFRYNACGPFTKRKKEIMRKLNKNRRFTIYLSNQLDKTCFQHDFAYGDIKDLTRRTASNEILCDEAFTFAKNLKHDGYQGVVVFHKKTSYGATKI